MLKSMLFALLGCAPDPDPGPRLHRAHPPPGPTGASSAAEPTPLACADQVLAGPLPASIAGTTVGQGDDVPSSCASGDGRDGSDRAVAFEVPASGTYAFSTLRSPSRQALAIHDGCGGVELACQYHPWDQVRVVLDLVAGQTVIVVVEGGDAFVLDVFARQPAEVDCADGLDEDLDGDTDCIDEDCAGEPECLPTCPTVALAGGLASYTGDTVGLPDTYLPKCNAWSGYELVSDASVAFTVPSDGAWGVQVVGHAFPEATLALLAGCDGLELGCGRIATADVTAGQTLVAVVEGDAHASDGVFTVHFFPVAASETSCADGIDDDVGDGADCLDPDCELDPACAEDCANGIDDDADGYVDCGDLGCRLDPVCIEADCADGADDDADRWTDCQDPDCDVEPSCDEACDDGADDDGDGRLDCLDGSCADDPACDAGCPEAFVAAGGSVTGSAVGLADDVQPSCSYYRGYSDWSVGFVAPADGRYLFHTVGTGSSHTLAVTDGCAGAELACDAPSGLDAAEVALDLAGGRAVVAWIDGHRVDPAQLEIVEVPSAESSCGDGIDEDVDGAADCADADCSGARECDEGCADDLDDNGNGLVDCLDPECAGDAACAPGCPEGELAGPLPIRVVGSTLGETADQASPCANGAPGPDRTWSFTAPAAGTYTFDTVGSSFDTVLYVLDGCGGAPLGCNDDVDYGGAARVEVALEAGQAVVVVVDGYGTAAGEANGGSYALEVR